MKAGNVDTLTNGKLGLKPKAVWFQTLLPGLQPGASPSAGTRLGVT